MIEIAARPRSPRTWSRRPHTTPVRRLDEATAARQPEPPLAPDGGAETPLPGLRFAGPTENSGVAPARIAHEVNLFLVRAVWFWY